MIADLAELLYYLSLNTDIKICRLPNFPSYCIGNGKERSYLFTLYGSKILLGIFWIYRYGQWRSTE